MRSFNSCAPQFTLDTYLGETADKLCFHQPVNLLLKLGISRRRGVRQVAEVRYAPESRSGAGDKGVGRKNSCHPVERNPLGRAIKAPLLPFEAEHRYNTAAKTGRKENYKTTLPHRTATIFSLVALMRFSQASRRCSSMMRSLCSSRIRPQYLPAKVPCVHVPAIT